MSEPYNLEKMHQELAAIQEDHRLGTKPGYTVYFDKFIIHQSPWGWSMQAKEEGYSFNSYEELEKALVHRIAWVEQREESERDE